MSGRGGRARGRGNRYGGRGGSRSYEDSTTSLKRADDGKKEYFFHPHSAGSQQVTFSTIKEYIVHLVQRTFNKGIDIASAIDEEINKSFDEDAPRRAVSVLIDPEERIFEQETFDMKF